MRKFRFILRQAQDEVERFQWVSLMVSMSNHGPHRFSAACRSSPRPNGRGQLRHFRIDQPAPLSRLFRRRGLGMSKRGGPAMAAVRGVGFSSAVQEDIYFDRLRENLDQAEELGVDFVELPLLRDGPDRWRPVAAVANAPAAATPLRRGRLDTPRTALSASISCNRQRSSHAI